MLDTKKVFLSPFDQGRYARIDNEPRDNNPFDPDFLPKAYMSWTIGWLRPFKDKQEEEMFE
jgi:hypothetical protein